MLNDGTFVHQFNEAIIQVGNPQSWFRWS